MHKNMMRYLLFFILFSFVGAINASAAVKLDESTYKIDITKHSDLFVDSQNHFSFEDVSGDLFDNNFGTTGNEPTYGSQDTVWMRFELSNDSDSTFFGKIELPLYWLNKTDIYLKEGSGAVFYDEEIKGRSFFAPLEIKANSSAVVYLKAKPEGSFALEPILHSQRSSFNRATYISMLNGALLGAVFIMLFYTLYNFFVFREKNYMYYIFYLSGMILILGINYGFVPELFWSRESAFGQRLYYLIVSFSYISAILFTVNFLDTAKEFVKMYKYSLALIAMSVAVGVFGLVNGGSAATQYLVLFYNILYFLFLLVLSAVSAKKEISGSSSLLLAWVFLSTGQVSVSAMDMGIVRYHDFIYDIYALTVAANIVLISFALVSRVKDEESRCEIEVKKEHELADRLNTSKKELRIINKKLQQKVDKQDRELQERQKEYAKLSVMDELTGLYNKNKLEEVLTNELHRAKRYGSVFSVILINIDGLKNINDTHGYEVGNSVIKETADIFARHMRYLDSAGRWSETEYLVVCPQTNAAQAFTAAEHFQSMVEKYKFFFVGRATASFGVTDYRAEDTMQEIMKRAYEALAKAKEEGRNRVEVL